MDCMDSERSANDSPFGSRTPKQLATREYPTGKDPQETYSGDAFESKNQSKDPSGLVKFAATKKRGSVQLVPFEMPTTPEYSHPGIVPLDFIKITNAHSQE